MDKHVRNLTASSSRLQSWMDMNYIYYEWEYIYLK